MFRTLNGTIPVTRAAKHRPFVDSSVLKVQQFFLTALTEEPRVYMFFCKLAKIASEPYQLLIQAFAEEVLSAYMSFDLFKRFN